jgi:hypothetical protein
VSPGWADHLGNRRANPAALLASAKNPGISGDKTIHGSHLVIERADFAQSPNRNRTLTILGSVRSSGSFASFDVRQMTVTLSKPVAAFNEKACGRRSTA